MARRKPGDGVLADLGDDCVVHLLGEQRHGQEDRGGDFAHVLGHGAEVLHDADLAHRAHRHEEVSGEGEGVVQGKHEQEVVRSADGEVLKRALELGGEVAVREHGALGAPRRAGGVDDRGDVDLGGDVAVEERVRPLRVGLRGGEQRGEVVVADAVGLFRFAEDAVEEHDVLERGQAALDFADERPELAAGEERAGFRVVEDVGDFALLQARVDGDDFDAAAGEAEVDDHPFGAVLHHHRDALTGLDSELAGRLGDVAGLLQIVAVGPGAPDAFGLPAHGDSIGTLRGGVEKNSADR